MPIPFISKEHVYTGSTLLLSLMVVFFLPACQFSARSRVLKSSCPQRAGLPLDQHLLFKTFLPTKCSETQPLKLETGIPEGEGNSWGKNPKG